MDRVLDALDKRNISIAMFIDLSKVFNTVNQSILSSVE